MDLATTEKQSIRIAITDLDVPFGRLCLILVKLVLAVIPAVIVGFAALGLLNVIFMALTGAA